MLDGLTNNDNSIRKAAEAEWDKLRLNSPDALGRNYVFFNGLYLLVISLLVVAVVSLDTTLMLTYAVPPGSYTSIWYIGDPCRFVVYTIYYHSFATLMCSGGVVFPYFQSFHNTGVPEGNIQCFASLLVWIEVRLIFPTNRPLEAPFLPIINEIESQGPKDWCL